MKDVQPSDKCHQNDLLIIAMVLFCCMLRLSNWLTPEM